jgi:hypothetical protein
LHGIVPFVLPFLALQQRVIYGSRVGEKMATFHTLPSIVKWSSQIISGSNKTFAAFIAQKSLQQRGDTIKTFWPSAQIGLDEGLAYEQKWKRNNGHILFVAHALWQLF